MLHSSLVNYFYCLILWLCQARFLNVVYKLQSIVLAVHIQGFILVLIDDLLISCSSPDITFTMKLYIYCVKVLFPVLNVNQLSTSSSCYAWESASGQVAQSLLSNEWFLMLAVYFQEDGADARELKTKVDLGCNFYVQANV